MRSRNAGVLLGESDDNGLILPEQFPLTVNVAPWPSTPGELEVTDDGREHVLVVARRCSVDLSWDPPGDPEILDIAFGVAAPAPIGLGKATIEVPCGDAVVTPETAFSGTARVEPVPATIDTRAGTGHIQWAARDSVRICVTDESGAPLPEATIGGSWPDGDCWRYPGTFCARPTAPGFLAAELCPEVRGADWSEDDYTIALERGVPVALQCDDGSGPGPCPARVGILQCVSASTPDSGTCWGDPWTCLCPDAPDAAVLCQAGRYPGERAVVHDGLAILRHTGTASLTVPSPEFCETSLLRDEPDGQVIIGKLRCHGGPATRTQLLAGTYVVSSFQDGSSTSWSGIHLAEGEHKVVNLGTPGGHPVALDWSGTAPDFQTNVVVLGNFEAVTFKPGPVQVPPGATLWVCAKAGCCRYDDPGERVSCDPDPAEMPPMARLRL
jgi:hypothetical protein